MFGMSLKQISLISHFLLIKNRVPTHRVTVPLWNSEFRTPYFFIYRKKVLLEISFAFVDKSDIVSIESLSKQSTIAFFQYIRFFDLF